MFSLIVAAVLTALVVAWVLQLASKIVCGEAIHYGDAFKTAFMYEVLTKGIAFGLNAVFEGGPNWILGLAISYLVWSVLIMVVVGLTIKQSFVVAAVLVVLRSLIAWGFVALLLLLTQS